MKADSVTRPIDATTPWGIVVLLGSLTALGAMSVDMYLPSLPAINAHFHAPEGAAQSTLATFFAGLAIGQFFYGPASTGGAGVGRYSSE